MPFNDKPITFNKVDQFSVGHIKMSMFELEKEWSKDLELWGVTAFKNLSFCFIYKTDTNWNVKEQFNPGKVNTENQFIISVLEPMINILEKVHEGKRGNVFIVTLPMGLNVEKHQNMGDYFDKVRRHYIPIQTDGKVVFTIDDQPLRMGEGDCWEINNSLTRSWVNNSSLDNYMLVIDIMPDTEII
jgi:hypothetical protein